MLLGNNWRQLLADDIVEYNSCLIQQIQDIYTEKFNIQIRSLVAK